MIQRLVDLMRLKNLTSSQLADSIGVQRSGISHFISGRNKPSLEFILKILNHFPDINPDWLLFGKEPVLRDGDAAINIQEDIKVPWKGIFDPGDEIQKEIQPSFLEELFTEQVTENEEKTKEPAKSVKDQQLKPNKARGTETSKDKLPVAGEEIIPVDSSKSENTDRIVVFYKNRTFREYFPE